MRMVAGVSLIGLVCCGPAPMEPDRVAECRAPANQTAAESPEAADTLWTVVPDLELSSEQQEALDRINGWSTTAEVHVVRLYADPEAVLEVDRSIVVKVSPTRTFIATGQHVGTTSSGGRSWRGDIADDFGSVTLILGATGLHGSIQSVPTDHSSTDYGVELLGGDLYAVVCKDLRMLPPEHPPVIP